jgi:hypothetical protein
LIPGERHSRTIRGTGVTDELDCGVDDPSRVEGEVEVGPARMPSITRTLSVGREVLVDVLAQRLVFQGGPMGCERERVGVICGGSGEGCSMRRRLV